MSAVSGKIARPTDRPASWMGASARMRFEQAQRVLLARLEGAATYDHPSSARSMSRKNVMSTMRVRETAAAMPDAPPRAIHGFVPVSRTRCREVLLL